MTVLAKAVTEIATTRDVGLALVIGLPLVLLLARRRPDAVTMLCMFAGHSVALIVIATAGWRYAAIVLGGMLCALTAAFAVTGLAALPAVQPWLRRLDTRTGATPRNVSSRPG